MVTTGCISVTVNDCNPTINVTVGCKSSIDVSFECKNSIANVCVTHLNDINVDYEWKDYGMNVTCGLVCSVSLGEHGEEIWWSNGWRVDWKNGIPTLWRN